MPVTFLQMCQQVRQETGLQGVGPVSVVAAIGEEKKIVDWVRAAWEEVQRLRSDWTFMQADFSMTTEAGIMRYPLVATSGLDHLSKIYTDMVTARAVNDSRSAEATIHYIDYPGWRRQYDVGIVAQGPVAGFSVAPGGDLLVFPKPDGGYVLRGCGRLRVQHLADNNDVIRLDDEYVDVVKWRAVMMFAGFEEAAAIYQHAEINYNNIMRRMQIELLPPFDNYVEPLA